MKKVFSTLSIILFTTCLLVACGATPTAGTTPPPPTIPPVAASTLPPEPSRTPLPLPTRRPSQTLPPTETPVPTQINPADEMGGAPFHCDYRDSNIFSPSENWYICRDASFFTVADRNGTSWTFSAPEQLGMDNLGELSFLHWTANEKFLYFSVYHGLGVDNFDGANANALFRMDLSNGKVATVLGKLDPDSQGIYFTSISPNSRRLAYSIYRTYQGNVISPIKLHVLDLVTGEEKEFPLEPEYYSIVDLVWSDDGDQAAYKLYAAREGGRDVNDICDYLYSIKVLDLVSFESTTFVKNEAINTCTDSVFFNILAVLADRVTLDRNGDIWIYNVESQRLELQGTITPSP